MDNQSRIPGPFLPYTTDIVKRARTLAKQARKGRCMKSWTISNGVSPMAKYRVDVSEPAESDLRDIVRYIAAQLSAPVSALQMVELLEAGMEGLSGMPQRCALVADERLARMGYRMLVVNNALCSFR